MLDSPPPPIAPRPAAAEQALRESEQRLQLALEAAQMGVVEYDSATGRIVFTGNFVRLLGYEPEKVPESLDWFFSRVHPDDRAFVRAAVANVTNGEGGGELHYRVVRRDGSVRWWAGRSRLLPNEQGQKTRVIAACADVTDRRDLEEQFRQSLKLEAIGQLAGGIAHDFNNLLTVITGYAETVIGAIDADEPIAADVVEIRRAAERAAMLTQQLLAFSRKQVLRPEVVDANDVVRDISAMIARLIGKRIHLTADLGGTQTPVLADRGQLEQVLLNLAVNARDAMPSGGLLQMSTRAVDISPEEAKRLYPMRTGRYVRLSVRDTGIGMTPEVRARVFEPFFTTKAAGEGTGIGLSTVYRIVKQSGGFIFVESAPQQGATFDVYLPFTTAPAKEGTDAVQDASRACTILLVEDYRRIRELARKILTRQGYRVLTAGSGDEALSLAATYDGTIDLLLTDVMMPGLSGPDLAQRVHRVRPHVPVLYMSGEGSGPLGVADPEGRGGAFLQKPFTPASLAQKVREVLNKTAAERCQ